MRILKITRSVSRENECSQESIPQFESTDEGLEYIESKFEKRTGLKEGAKVHYIGINDAQIKRWNNSYSDPRSILNTNTVYEIEYLEIHRSFTIVKLVGFREEKFIGGIFEAVDKTEPRNSLKKGDTVRYIGRNEQYIKQHSVFCSNPNNILNYEDIYEVISFERHPAYIGLKVVTLVGFEEYLFNRMLFEKVITAK